MDKIKLKVHAKVNLALDIVGKYADGYHELDMIMASVNLFDTLTMEKSDQNIVTMDGQIVGREYPYIQDDKSQGQYGCKMDGQWNTAVKALELLTFRYGIRMKVDIIKGIPKGAGLGGSSADASGVFVGASKLFGIPLKELEPLAIAVGSDVVYMMYGGFARVKGKGEIVQPITLRPMNLVVAQAEVGESTAMVYHKYDELMTKKGDIDTALDNIRKNGRGFFNCLQESAIALSPFIKTTMKDIYTYTDRVFLTGSGSAVVGIFDSESQAKWCELNFGAYLCAKALHTVDSGIEIVE